jgi:hypothetical protein
LDTFIECQSLAAFSTPQLYPTNTHRDWSIVGIFKATRQWIKTLFFLLPSRNAIAIYWRAISALGALALALFPLRDHLRKNDIIVRARVQELGI